MTSPPDNSTQETSEDKDKARSPRSRVGWLKSPWVLGVGTAVISGLLLSSIFGVFHRFDPGPAPAADLKLRNVVVTSSSVSPLRPETVDLTFLDVGTQTAILTRATIRIQEFTSFPVSFNSGYGFYILPDHQYSVTMPLRPSPGQVVPVDLSEGVAVGGTDDFGLDFKLPADAGFFIYLYRVEISVHYGDATSSVEVLVSLPANPGLTYKCSSHSETEFCGILRLSGYRPAAISKLQS